VVVVAYFVCNAGKIMLHRQVLQGQYGDKAD